MCWSHSISIIADSKHDKKNYVNHTFSIFIFVHAGNMHVHACNIPGCDC